MTTPTLKIATWNLDHPKPNSWKKSPKILNQIEAINADVWILTETNNLAIDLSSKGYSKFSSTEYEDSKGSKQNSYTTIWSRIQAPTQAIDTFDQDIAVCIKVDLQEYSLLIYGTIITWHGDRGTGHSKNWEEHYRSIEQHGSDWNQLMETNPDSKLLIAGDFNQARDGSGWYGTQQGIQLLTDQLNSNKLICLTDRVKPQNRHNIDHICVSQELQTCCKVGVWENISDDNIIMTDHNGVFVDIEILQ